jgi:hypothetical protein
MCADGPHIARRRSQHEEEEGTMDHVVVPLDEDHRRSTAAIASALCERIGGRAPPADVDRHITLVSFCGAQVPSVLAGLRATLPGVEPFVVRAHGYGFFRGDGDDGLSLHVPVVRSPPLELLHRRVHGALVSVGADIAGWTAPALWSPHITLLDRDLEPDGLATAVRWLASHHHPSWHVPVDRVLVVGGRRDGAARRGELVLIPTS